MSLMPIGLSGFPTLPGAEPGVVSLLAGGRVYEGWISVEVRRSLKETAGQFLLHVAEAFVGDAAPPSAYWPIREDDECQVFYGGRLVVTGHIDVRKPKYDFKNHEVTLQGRSKTRNLVDSSVDGELKKGEAKRVPFSSLIRRVTKNFGIQVMPKGSDLDRVIETARVEPGETVHEFIDRYGRHVGACSTDDQAGRLRLLQIEDGAAVASIIEGVNILEAGATLRADNRHSKVEAHGQNKGTDNKFGKQAARVKASANDSSVKTYRPLRILSESRVGDDDVKRRSAWESASRAGESVRVEARVVDWVKPNGELWMPGDIVFVSSPMIPIARNLVVQSLQHRQSRSTGTITALVLVPPEAVNNKKGGKGGGKGNDPSFNHSKPSEDPS